MSICSEGNMGCFYRFRINWGDQPKEGEEGGQQEGSSSILQVTGNDIIQTAVFHPSVESISVSLSRWYRRGVIYFFDWHGY